MNCFYLKDDNYTMIEIDTNYNDNWQIKIIYQDKIDQREFVDILDKQALSYKELLRFVGHFYEARETELLYCEIKLSEDFDKIRKRFIINQLSDAYVYNNDF